MDKSGGMVDALDSAEYSGSLIILLNEGVSFVKRNMKTRWKKTANSRIEMPDYCERSVFEALVNALIHRDYLILGSEVHIDIYDDDSVTAAGNLISKLKAASLIVPVKGYGKGKYRFIEPHK